VIQGLLNGASFVILVLIPSKYINIQEVNRLKAMHSREIPEIGGTGETNMNLNSPFSGYENERKEVSLSNAISYLCGNLPYLAIVTALTGLFFVISGVQYWASHYL
jgi:hypothetical protein